MSAWEDLLPSLDPAFSISHLISIRNPTPRSTPPPGHLQPAVLKLQSHFLLRDRKSCWDHTLFFHEKWLSQKISPSVPTINTDVHVSLEYSLPSFATLLKGLESSFSGKGKARPRLEVLDSLGWSIHPFPVIYDVFSSWNSCVKLHNSSVKGPLCLRVHVRAVV